ncbi:MAG: PepSY domain-containing protein [Hyphomonas sp.]|uniref:PepSY domain-containing protein n=1 Tax=Hyphomonas sp. TaxID=87 RepID=UPI001D8A219F|nr:PepSY domain-containing protein [Hyphomonas sp.]MBA4227211.1 PepSY domain-containing protein [Hyphomonas sp.]
MKHISAALIAAALAAPVPFALAQSGGAETISREQAIDIASQKGMVHVLEIELDDGEWEIEGCTADGREVEIDVHSRTGEILKYDLDRDTDDDCLRVMR